MTLVSLKKKEWNLHTNVRSYYKNKGVLQLLWGFWGLIDNNAKILSKHSKWNLNEQIMCVIEKLDTKLIFFNKWDNGEIIIQINVLKKITHQICKTLKGVSI